MKQLKKTLLTLVALLAVTTGAWAEDTFGVIEITADMVPADWDGDNTIVSPEDLATLGITFFEVTKAQASAWADYPKEGTVRLLYAYSTGFSSVDWDDGTPDGDSWNFKRNQIYKANATGYRYFVTVPNAAPTGPEVSGPTIVEGKPQWTFTMPGGNVTLEPEYYPQATLTAAPTAINDVPATTDGAIVEAGTVANIGETTTAQGTVMYYVSQTALDDAALLALDADQWTADVPTAESLAQGQAYVYYYVRGNNSDTDEENFSDGDIKAANALPVTIAAAPTYAVTFADDTAEPTLWTATPNADVKKGQTVTVTYSGSKKVIGVKAEKKAAAATLQTVNIGGDTSATLYYLPGETFGQAIANHPENSSFEIKGGYITCNGLWLSIGYYDGDVTPDTLVEANGDYRGLLA